jgi:hypothetical protein
MLAALNFIGTVFVFAQRIVKISFDLINIRAVLLTLLIQKIHIAMSASLTFFHTPVPRIPNIVHTTFLGLAIKKRGQSRDFK